MTLGEPSGPLLPPASCQDNGLPPLAHSPVPQPTGEGITNQGLPARPLTPALARNESRWGLVCPLSQHVLTEHVLGADAGQASDLRGGGRALVFGG